MTNPTQNPNKNLNQYKLEQSINKVYEILQSNILMHHVSKGLSVLFEIALYLLLLLLIIFIAGIPNNPLEMVKEIDEETRVKIALENDTIIGAMIACKLIMFVLLLPILGMAILVRRNRKKNTLIRQAFEEAQRLKDNYESNFENKNAP